MRRPILSAVFTVFFFLMQVCVMPYLRIGQAEGSLLWAWIAVVTVSLDKKYAFCASAVIGILTECAVSSVTLLYMVLYPVIAMLFSLAFADMTEKNREKRRSGGKKRQDDRPALLRIPLCAVCTDGMFHVILIGYSFLIGNGLSFMHLARMLGSVLYTLVLTLLLMVPLRKALDIRAWTPPFRENTPERSL